MSRIRKALDALFICTSYQGSQSTRRLVAHQTLSAYLCVLSSAPHHVIAIREGGDVRSWTVPD